MIHLSRRSQQLMDQCIPFIDHLLDVALPVRDSIQGMAMLFQRLLKETPEDDCLYSLIVTSSFVSIKRIRKSSLEPGNHSALEYIPLSRDPILNESDFVEQVRTRRSYRQRYAKAIQLFVERVDIVSHRSCWRIVGCVRTPWRC